MPGGLDDAAPGRRAVGIRDPASAGIGGTHLPAAGGDVRTADPWDPVSLRVGSSRAGAARRQAAAPVAVPLGAVVHRPRRDLLPGLDFAGLFVEPLVGGAGR